MTETHELRQSEPRPTSRLSTFMKVSITILSIVTVLSISLLFIGDFAGRFERVFSTLVLFAAFVGLTMFDTRRDRKFDWYAPLALIANTYILGLLLVIIWVTPYDPLALQFIITWQSLYVIVVTRLAVWALSVLFRRAESEDTSLARWSQATGVLALLSLVFFTAPLGFSAFSVVIPELYWKFAVASLILTGLGLAVTLLLSWYFRSQDRQHAAAHARETYPPVVHATPTHSHVPHTPVAQPQPAYPQQAPAPAPVQAAPAVPSGQQPPQPELLPWPTFADGSPYPMGADGQPDFEAAARQQ